MSFEWQTEEEEWAAGSVVGQGKPSARARLPLLLLVFVVALITGLLWWQAGRRAEAAESQARREVLATDKLVHDAAQQQDWELLEEMLSGRDLDWVSAQALLLDKGLLFAGGALLPGIEPILSEPGQSDVTVSTDLSTVTVTVRYEYPGRTTGGEVPVAFHQLHVYRRGAERWLLSAPDRSFWGAGVPVAGKHITVLAPARDRPLTARLVQELDEHWDRLCQESAALDCTEALDLSVQFSRDPRSLLYLSESPFPLQEQAIVELPAPSLIGQPEGEVAYQALYRAYARWLLSVALARELHLASACCMRADFYQAAIEWWLHEEQLQDWPLEGEEYRQALVALEGPGQLHALWEADQPEKVSERERWLIYSLVELLLADVRATPDAPALLASIQQHENVAPWVRAVSGSRSIAALYPIWREALVERMQPGESATEPALSQDLVLACVDDSDNYIYRYREGEWSELFPREQGFMTFYPFADDDALLLSGSRPATGIAQTVLWQPGAMVELARAAINSIHLVETAGASPLVLAVESLDSFFIPAAPVTDPQEQYASAWYYQDDARVGEMSLVDLSSCRQPGGCRWEAVSGRPVWSPDGKRLLLVSGRGVLLYRERADSNWTSLAAGRSPFWINDTTYGYLEVDGQQIRLGQIGSDGVDPVWLGIDDLFAGLELADSPRLINQVIAGPTALAVLATDRRQRLPYLFLLPRPATVGLGIDSERTVPPVKLLLRGVRLDEEETPLSFSPDGRWLVVYGRSLAGGPRSFWLYDLVRQQLLVLAEMAEEAGALSLSDWSADGTWLAHWWGEGLVELVAPGPEATRRYLAPPAHSPQGNVCRSLAWINREMP